MKYPKRSEALKRYWANYGKRSTYVRTEEHKEKMRLIKMGQTHTEESKRKIKAHHYNVKGKNNPMWGKKRPQYVKDAVSKANKGRIKTEKEIELTRKANLGRKVSIETRRKLSLAQRGEKGSNWQGGKTKNHQLIRRTFEYVLWREEVFVRDNYTCQECGIKGGKLNADHIKPFALYPELRFDVSNGRTLCLDCHKKTDSYGYKLSNKTRWHRDNVPLLPEEKVFLTSNGI